MHQRINTRTCACAQARTHTHVFHREFDNQKWPIDSLCTYSIGLGIVGLHARVIERKKHSKHMQKHARSTREASRKHTRSTHRAYAKNKHIHTRTRKHIGTHQLSSVSLRRHVHSSQPLQSPSQSSLSSHTFALTIQSPSAWLVMVPSYRTTFMPALPFFFLPSTGTFTLITTLTPSARPMSSLFPVAPAFAPLLHKAPRCIRGMQWGGTNQQPRGGAVCSITNRKPPDASEACSGAAPISNLAGAPWRHYLGMSGDCG